jgi:quercetin dioxygenase-like cupin family protein
MPPATTPTTEIVNDRTGQRMRFEEPGSPEVLRIECWSPAAGVREPKHSHPRQESRFELLSGQLVFEIDGIERTIQAPDSVTIPAGARHRFWNAGPGEAHYVQEFRPALSTRGFFELLFRLANEGRLDEKGMPSLLDVPALFDASEGVIRPISPPWAVLRLTAALMRPFAAIRGRRRPASP